MKSQPCTLTAVFTRWHHVTKFDKLHKMIRKQNRLNRRNRLEAFLEESVPFVLRNQMHEWYRRVRTLCPKQQHRRIQMFDPTGAPMSQDQELDRLVEYFQTLFTDVHSPLHHPPPLQTLPFTEEDVQLELERHQGSGLRRIPCPDLEAIRTTAHPHHICMHSSSLDL